MTKILPCHIILYSYHDQLYLVRKLLIIKSFINCSYTVRNKGMGHDWPVSDRLVFYSYRRECGLGSVRAHLRDFSMSFYAYNKCPASMCNSGSDIYTPLFALSCRHPQEVCVRNTTSNESALNLPLGWPGVTNLKLLWRFMYVYDTYLSKRGFGHDSINHVNTVS